MGAPYEGTHRFGLAQVPALGLKSVKKCVTGVTSKFGIAQYFLNQLSCMCVILLVALSLYIYNTCMVDTYIHICFEGRHGREEEMDEEVKMPTSKYNHLI